MLNIKSKQILNTFIVKCFDFLKTNTTTSSSRGELIKFTPTRHNIFIVYYTKCFILYTFLPIKTYVHSIQVLISFTLLCSLHRFKLKKR